MIHIKNKKKPLEVTIEEMRKFSLSYLEKYAPSKQQLKTYLLKKYLFYKIKVYYHLGAKDLFFFFTYFYCRKKILVFIIFINFVYCFFYIFIVYALRN